MDPASASGKRVQLPVGKEFVYLPSLPGTKVRRIQKSVVSDYFYLAKKR